MRPTARLRLRTALALTLATTAVAIAGPVGCAGKAATRRGLPRPLELPADPPAAFHLDDPARALELASPALGKEVGVRPAIERELARHVPEAAAGRIAAAIDPSAPMDAVRLSPAEEIFRAHVVAAKAADLSAALGEFPAEGDFGARRLSGEAGGGEGWLAWFDERSATVTFARSLRGLATGPELERAYGQRPVFATVDGALLVDEAPFERVRAEGRLEDLEIVADLEEGFDLGAELPLANGAMTGLLGHRELVAAVSSRWTGHEEAVNAQLKAMRSMVKKQNFFVQGILADMVDKLAAVMRDWDGRFVAGVGPGGHLMLAYGTEDPKSAGRNLLILLGTVVDNIKLARNFTSQVPRISIKRNVRQVGEDPIHRVIVGGIKAQVPKEMRGLLDDKGQLRVAFSFPRRAGGVVFAVGPEPSPVLQRWLEESATGPSGEQSREDWAALAVRLSSRDLGRLIETEDPSELIGQLEPRGPHRLAVARREGERRVVVRLTSSDQGG